MSVNIFGSSRANASSGTNNKYVDQKFKTLSTNLATKINKTGDTISGNLHIVLDQGDSKTFGFTGISIGKSILFLLGDVKNAICYHFGDPMEMTARHGVKFSTPDGDVCQLGGGNTK